MSKRNTTIEGVKLSLTTNGDLTPEAAEDFLQLICEAIPPKQAKTGTKTKFIPAEFVGELEEQVLEDITKIAADNPRREAELAHELMQNLPPPDERLRRVQLAAERVQRAVRKCFIGMRLRKPKIKPLDDLS